MNIKRIIRIATLIIVMLLITWAASNIMHKSKKTEPVDISKKIKKHNEVTQEHNNSMFPSVAKPANSKVTVFAGDSVKVIPKN
jgi:hypothetical protein